MPFTKIPFKKCECNINKYNLSRVQALLQSQPSQESKRPKTMDHHQEESYQPFTIQISSSSSSSSSSATATAAPSSGVREREPMFNKVLTPSDVGKLNRLVIPKQQAERYFPLLGPGSPDKGTELTFEDLRTSKQWLFRYCYWGSSQSYVMTKGWSRFVRENNLTPGDTILFSREVILGQFFIDFRHNQPAPPPPPLVSRELRPAMSLARSTPNVTHMFFDFLVPQPVISDVRRGVRLFGVNIDSERQNQDVSIGIIGRFQGREPQDERESRSI